MSEKRFEYNYKTGRICDNETDWQCTSNMLHLERRLNELDKLNKKLSKENEQLKQELEMFKPVMFQDMRKGTVILYRKGGDVE